MAKTIDDSTLFLQMDDVVAIVLGGGRGSRLWPLTDERAKPAVPLVGRYRLIDIPLSNCLHSKLDRIFVLTQFNSGSLNRHITNAYKFDNFTPGTSMSLSKWEGYFDGSPKGDPALGAIEYRAIPDPSTQMAELMGGGLDWIWYVPADQAEPLSGVPGVAVNPAETMRISFLSFNLRDMDGGNPLQDIRVRQAIAHAIDRETIVRQVVGQGSGVVTSPCFRTQFGCPADVPGYGYDPEKAKALLAEAGVASGLTLDLVANSSRDRAWTEAVAGYLNAVGIQLNVQMLQYAAVSERVATNRTHLFMGDWGSYGINDVSALLNNFFTMGADDMARDEEVSNALKAAAATINQEERLANYNLATRRINEQAMWHPLWTNPVTYAHSENLDFRSFPDENPRFYLVKWKD